MNNQPAPPQEKTAEPARHRAVSALRHALDAADPGTVAALRRASADSPPAAFYRLALAPLEEHLPPGGPPRDEYERRWTVVVSAMATALGLLGRIPFGEALARSGIAEARVTRLLEAHDAQLADLVRHVVHQLVQKGEAFDPNDLADLVLSDGTSYAAHARRRIARFFFRYLDARETRS